MPNRGAAPLDLSNGLLKLLPADDLDRMRPFLEPVALRLGQVLLGHGDTVESVFFIQSGTVSMVSTMEDGSRIEVGMVGYEGMVGLPLLLGSLWHRAPALWLADPARVNSPAPFDTVRLARRRADRFVPSRWLRPVDPCGFSPCTD